MLLRFTKLWDEVNPFSEKIVGQTGYVRGGPCYSSLRAAKSNVLRTSCLRMPVRTALPWHIRAHAHAAQCASPLRNKRSQLLIDARLRGPGQSTGCPRRSCSHLREAKCGTQRTHTRTITAPTVHDAPHMRPFWQIVHAVTAAPTAQNACVRTTL